MSKALEYSMFIQSQFLYVLIVIFHAMSNSPIVASSMRVSTNPSTNIIEPCSYLYRHLSRWLNCSFLLFEIFYHPIKVSKLKERKKNTCPATAEEDEFNVSTKEAKRLLLQEHMYIIMSEGTMSYYERVIAEEIFS